MRPSTNRDPSSSTSGFFNSCDHICRGGPAAVFHTRLPPRSSYVATAEFGGLKNLELALAKAKAAQDVKTVTMQKTGPPVTMAQGNAALVTDAQVSPRIPLVKPLNFRK